MQVRLNACSAGQSCHACMQAIGTGMLGLISDILILCDSKRCAQRRRAQLAAFFKLSVVGAFVASGDLNLTSSDFNRLICSHFIAVSVRLWKFLQLQLHVPVFVRLVSPTWQVLIWSWL